MDRISLVAILQKAHAGELAAALAYAGHWRSLPPGEDRATIQRIEHEELVHRLELGAMLDELCASPSVLREVFFRIVGIAIGYLCHVGGRFIPMYGAERLEAANVREYEEAAACAGAAGYDHFVAPLLRMSAVEAEHERYFRAKVSGHWLGRIVPIGTRPSLGLHARDGRPHRLEHARLKGVPPTDRILEWR